MKAITYTNYGPPEVLRLGEVDKPAVNDDEVLVRVSAASVNPYDWHFLRGKPYFMRLSSGMIRPKITGLGADMAGTVEAVGKNVTRFRLGDEVFAQVDGGATFAEYACVAENAAGPKPSNITFEQAAAVPMGALTALQGLRNNGQIGPGQHVLVNGASGGVGTFAVQIAKALGAEVTGVCSTRNLEMVRSIGADQVIDYTREDFTEGARRYDIVLDTVGNRSLSACRRVMTANGMFVVVGGPDGWWLGPLPHIFKTLLQSLFVTQKAAVFVATPNEDDLRFLKDLIEAGEVTPVIDKTYKLEEVPEAIRYLETGRARGKVVIAV